MIYTESKEQSAEILRLLLPLMSRQVAAFHPPSYTLWYEYVADINPPLKEAMARMMASDAGLDEDGVRELYRVYISDRNDEAARRLQAELLRIVRGVSMSTEEADQSALRYGAVLQEQSARLKQHAAAGEIEAILSTLVSATCQMHESMTSLRTKLTEATSEAEELRHAMERLQTEALTDPLTGLLNRRGFDQVMKGVLHSDNPDGSNTCLIMADIDNFKQINDSYGHLFGDKVICTVARVLKSLTKRQDAVARFGGEEFALLLPSTPLSGAQTVAEKIRLAIERGRIRRSENSEPIGNITLSLGVAAYQPGMTYRDFIDLADKALYASKQAGRNRVTVKYSKAA